MNDTQLTDREFELLKQIFHEMYYSVFVHIPDDVLDAYYKRLYYKE